MRHLTLGEVVELHRRLLEQSGGASGIRELGLLESALAQPHATFDGADLHPTLVDKAAALGFALVANHPFVDGNKRVGHAAMEVLLILNGFEIDASADEQERVVLDVASDRKRAVGSSAGLGRRNPSIGHHHPPQCLASFSLYLKSARSTNSPIALWPRAFGCTLSSHANSGFSDALPA
jgi:death-on-curing protein